MLQHNQDDDFDSLNNLRQGYEFLWVISKNKGNLTSIKCAEWELDFFQDHGFVKKKEKSKLEKLLIKFYDNINIFNQKKAKKFKTEPYLLAKGVYLLSCTSFIEVMFSCGSFDVIYYFAYAALAILAVVVHEFFFCFHLTELFMR